MPRTRSNIDVLLLNGTLREYFSLYPSPREGEREEKGYVCPGYLQIERHRCQGLVTLRQICICSKFKLVRDFMPILKTFMVENVTIKT